MKELDDLFLGDPNEWLMALPDFQTKIINTLFQQSKDYENVAETWLNVESDNTSPFGSNKREKIPYKLVVDEVELLLRGDTKYCDTIKTLKSQETIIKGMIIISISNSIAPSIGTASIFIAPVIAIILFTISKVGKNAWLQMREEQRKIKDSINSEEQKMQP